MKDISHGGTEFNGAHGVVIRDFIDLLNAFCDKVIFVLEFLY